MIEPGKMIMMILAYGLVFGITYGLYLRIQFKKKKNLILDFPQIKWIFEQADSLELCIPKEDEIEIERVHFTREDFRLKNLLDTVESQLKSLEKFPEN